MLNIQRVLFPTDLSDGAARAFPQAASMAEWHGAELHVLNVAGRHDHRYSEMRKHFPIDAVRLKKMLDPAEEPDQSPTRRKPDLDGLTIVQEQIEAASPADCIVDYTSSADVDLVVMGTHGRRGVDRLLMGSVAEEVVRRAPCPVFTIRSDGNHVPYRAVRRILVPLDFSDASSAALAHAKELAQTYGAQLDLLHVIEEVMYPSSYGVEAVSIPTDEVVERVETALAGIARDDIGYEHVTVQATPGYASTTILDYASDHDVDLIVIATHGRTGVDRLLLGSVAERVVRRASEPVFVVKPFGKSLLETTKSARDAHPA